MLTAPTSNPVSFGTVRSTRVGSLAFSVRMSWLQFGAPAASPLEIDVITPGDVGPYERMLGWSFFMKSIALVSSLPNRKICVAMKMYPPPVLIGSGKMSLCFQTGSSRSSHVAGFFPPMSAFKRLVFEMKPKMPVYQPVQRPDASLNCAWTSLAFGDW